MVESSCAIQCWTLFVKHNYYELPLKLYPVLFPFPYAVPFPLLQAYSSTPVPQEKANDSGFKEEKCLF
jgi:hypothetical protein